jgi:O-antigen ligase
MAHQNLLGMMTEIVFLNLMAAMLEGERDRLVMLGAVAGAIIVAGGGSRAAVGLLGGMTVLLIVLSLIRNRTSSKVAIAAVAATLLAVTAPVALLTLNERFGGGALVTEDDVRESLEKAALAMSRDHPFGVGANLFAHVSNVERYAERAGVSWFGANRAVPVHNGYLLARAETGYHGMALFVLLLVVPMIAGFRHAFRYRRERSEGWVLGSATAMAAITVHSFVEFNALVYAAQLPLAMNIAIIAGRIRAVRLASRTEEDRTLARSDEQPGSPVADHLNLPRTPRMQALARPRDATNSGLPDRINRRGRN